jgi:hypothetical protein
MRSKIVYTLHKNIVQNMRRGLPILSRGEPIVILTPLVTKRSEQGLEIKKCNSFALTGFSLPGCRESQVKHLSDPFYAGKLKNLHHPTTFSCTPYGQRSSSVRCLSNAWVILGPNAPSSLRRHVSFIR